MKKQEKKSITYLLYSNVGKNLQPQGPLGLII